MVKILSQVQDPVSGQAGAKPACAPGPLEEAGARALFEQLPQQVLPFAAADRRARPDELLMIQEQERQRIAAELHDGLGQLLTLLKLELGNAGSMLAAGRKHHPELAASLQRARAHAGEALDELRRTVMDLYPSMLDDLGINATLSWFVRELEQAGTGLAIDLRLRASDAEVPAALRMAVFRILQEAVNNVVKHAQARRLRIDFSATGGILALLVEDDGRGFAPAPAGPLCRSGGGLAGIVKRANGSGGKCIIDSAPARGTRVVASWIL